MRWTRFLERMREKSTLTWYRVLVGILEERRHLENLGLDGRIIENWFKRSDVWGQGKKQWTGAENLAPTWFRTRNYPTRGESLYRLLHPGTILVNCRTRVFLDRSGTASLSFSVLLSAQRRTFLVLISVSTGYNMMWLCLLLHCK
jgi:hypothetical protein